MPVSPATIMCGEKAPRAQAVNEEDASRWGVVAGHVSSCRLTNSSAGSSYIHF